MRGQGDRDLAAELGRSGIRNQRVLDAMASLRRAEFVPASELDSAYEDRPLPIGYGQTISQPYIVALMTQELELEGHERVLEIGTGSGYQAAMLAALCRHVFSIEVIPALGLRAKETLARVGVSNVSLRVSDGALGWPEEAPFDRVILTAAPVRLPPALIAQLKPGGILIAPVGALGSPQELVRLRKSESGEIRVERLLPVQFVPLTAPAPQA